MRGDGSAYAALGLEPDADSDDIDRAYRRLIKRYHPDREGGDACRAADITRAYRELRGRPAPEEALQFFHDDEPSGGRGRGWVTAAMLLVIGVAALLIGTGPVTDLMHRLSPPSPQIALAGAAADGSDAMDQPVHHGAITAAVHDAIRIAAARNDAALLGASRECHRQLRLKPSTTRLDRCIAFDDAVAQIQDHDPMWDGGPFSQMAVTGRQWSAASALSNDYLAVDSRLDRIRVEVALALALAPPVPPKPASAG